MLEEPVKKGVDGQEEEALSESEISLKKKQIDFEKKKSSGELALEEKSTEQSGWVKWIILFLVALGMIAMIFFMF